MFRLIPARPSLRVLGIGVLLLLLLSSFFAVSVPVTRKLQDLSGANSDNVQWTLAQVEVEYFSLRSALTQDIAVTRSDPEEIRRRFDIFYSRIGTLRRAAVFEPLRADPAFAEALERVWTYLQGALPVIDTTDDRLRAGRRDLLAETLARRDDVRALSLGGISTFARLADDRREAVLATLRLTAGVALALIAGLALALVVLLQMFQEGQRSARDLRQTTSRLRAIVGTSLAAILVVDRQGRVLDYNGAAERVFGYTRAEMIGASMADKIVPPHLREAHGAGMSRYLKTGIPNVIGRGRVQLEAMRKSGEVFPAELSIATAQSDEGEIFVSFLRDISARVQAENELREARDKALAGEKAKADLLAVMSHEMRTPLNGLLGTLDLMQQMDLSPAQQKHVRNMLTSGHLLLHHVSDVLEITQLEAGAVSLNASDFQLRPLLEDLAESQREVARAQGNDLSVYVHPDADIPVHGDPMRLRQVLLNLLGNALKFTRDGAVSLEAEASGDGLFEFRVTDTGIGIPEQDLERVFEDFVTLDASYGRATEGTGLGLGITRRIVTAMGGQIGVESAEGEGALFWVRLPFTPARAPLSPDMPQEVAQAPDMPALQVLLVEDNPINRDVALAMLEGMGHSVAMAGDGEEGVARAAERPFDLILMDISMPRMDGTEAVRRIRASQGPNACTRIVAATANALPEDIARFRACGMDDVLIKPIRAVALRAILRNAAPATAAPDVLLDGSVLRELLEVLGPEAVAGMLQDIDRQATDILAEAAGQTPEARAERMHKLAGSVAILGAVRLRACLARMESGLRAGHDLHGIDAARALWASTRAQVGEIVAAARAEPQAPTEEGARVRAPSDRA